MDWCKLALNERNTKLIRPSHNSKNCVCTVNIQKCYLPPHLGFGGCMWYGDPSGRKGSALVLLKETPKAAPVVLESTVTEQAE